MTSLLRISALILIISLSACATQEPRPTEVTRPSGVALILTEEIKSNLVEGINPELQQTCEKIGGRNCSGWTAGSDKIQFRSGATIFMVAKVMGLKPNTTVNVEWKVYDPDGALFLRVGAPLPMPESWTIYHELNVYNDISISRVGKWNVKLFVNGEEEISRAFDIL